MYVDSAAPAMLVDGPAGPAEAPDTGANDGPQGRLWSWLEARALYIAGVAAVVVLSLGQVYLHIAQDTWLALLAGRIIATHGIPQHDYLTVMAHGVRWVDQQWLAQLLMYGVYKLGGLALLSVVYVAVTGAAFALAIMAARRLGGIERNIVLILPFGAFFYIATAISVRTQGFAYPLFVLTLWLLADAVRNPSWRRVYLVFPILILWGNLHGSATLGAGIAALYGVTHIVGRVRTGGAKAALDARGWAFIIGAPLALFVNPYGPSIVHYYGATLFNSEFSKLVTEWRPVTSTMFLAVPYLLLLVAIVWVLGRSGRRTPLFDQLALIVLGLAGIIAVRNITWFGLGAVILVPAVLGQARRPKPAKPRNVRLNLALAIGAIALMAISLLATLARPASWFERTYPAVGVGPVARLAAEHPNAKIFADVRFADWLVWHDPSLAGRIAYDTSFELLTAQQLSTLSSLTATRAPGEADPLASYGILVLDPKNKSSNKLILAKPGVKTDFRSKRMVVATKPAT
jgi:hypothetical protein